MVHGIGARNHPNQTRVYTEENAKVDDRAVMPADFAKLNERFRFTIDVAASKENAKLPRFWTASDNSLEKSWESERVYCNPPFSELFKWIRKAWAERNAELVVMLLPANRTEQPFWQQGIEPFRDRPGSILKVEFMAGRLRFMKPDLVDVTGRPPFACCLVIWDWQGAEFREKMLFD